MKNLNLHILVKALLYWYIFIFFSTEVLSYFHLIERPYILLGELLFWGFFLFIHKREILLQVQNFNFRSKSNLLIFVLFLLTFIQGFFSAPNTTDSMVYHLPRIMYWMQEKTLFQDVIRNLHDYMPPFGQYILLHLHLVFGNDKFLFFSQWIAFVVTVIVSRSIALHLGANKQIGNTVALLVACLPVAVMQATSTKIEMLVAAFVVICTYIVLKFKENNLLNYITLSFGLGLGFLTKQTFLLFSIIPLGIFIIKLLRSKKRRLLFLPLMLIIILTTQARFISQNLLLYGNPSGSPRDLAELSSNPITLPGVFSNLIKNTSLQIPAPIYTKNIENVIVSLHQYLKLDINDCSTTFCNPDFKFRVMPVIFPQEDIASNPFHLLLIVITGFVLLKQFICKKVNSFELFIYVLIIASFVIFSTFIKWQPFHSRMHLPFLIIGTIISVVILSKFKRGVYFVKGIQLVSVVLVLFLIAFNVLRPYISYTFFADYIRSFITPLNNMPESFLIKDRDQQYFNSRYYWYKPYIEMISLLKEEKNKEVSFNLTDGFEYPIWALMIENKINKRVIPYSKVDENTIIISTSEIPFSKDNYHTTCFKTVINYGYACISKKNGNI